MKLFQRIRDSLISDGNLRRYLLHATGEILLIMIGILLAFQVDNWNEQRNNKKAELIYYQNIKRQLNEDKGVINNNIDYNTRYLYQFYYAVQIIESHDKSKIDTLSKISLNLLRYSDFHRVSNTYESIVSTGQLKLLNNQKVIEGLQRLEETYVYINKMEDIHFDVIKLIVLPDLVESIQFDPCKVERPDALYTFKFKNRFTVLVDIMKEKNEVYDRAINGINEIVGLIDNELNLVD